ncbi:MAG: hypothetical protein V1648_03555 [Candidatus Aenigmatarchaeota archaeon]
MNSRRKGQVEFIVIVALVIIGVVVFVIASRQSIIPTAPTSGIPEEAKTIKDAVMNLMRAGVKEKLTLLYNQGGALNPSLSVKFGAFDTAIWSACGQNSIPDISKEIGSGILSYMRENLEDEMDFSGKTAKFDFTKARTEVDIVKDAINIRIYLPTKVETYDVQQPYEIVVASKLYDVMDFSKNFVDENSKTRFLEHVTLRNLMISNPESEYWVPGPGTTQIGCGNPLMKTRRQLLPGIEGIIKYTVSHITFNNPTPLRIAENPFYNIYAVNGKYYPGLQVAFAYPSYWDTQINKYFAMSKEPLRLIPKPIAPLIPFCMAISDVSYSFRYPTVLMVEDASMNQWFKFAVMVDINNTQPGQCDAEFGKESEYDRVCITDAKCTAKITVKNTTGLPVEGASVNFYICDVGTTDKNGVAEGNIPCMISELHVYAVGHRSYGDLFRSDELLDKKVTLQTVEDKIKIHFKVLETYAGTSIGDGIYDSYDVKDDSIDITEFPDAYGHKNLTAFISFTPKSPNYFTGEDTAVMFANFDENNVLTAVMNISGIQPVSYEVTASLADTTDDEKSLPVGFINTSIDIPEGTQDIYIYMPYVTRTNGGMLMLTEPGIDPAEADKMTTLLYNKCGGKYPVSIAELSC